MRWLLIVTTATTLAACSNPPPSSKGPVFGLNVGQWQPLSTDLVPESKDVGQ